MNQVGYGKKTRAKKRQGGGILDTIKNFTKSHHLLSGGLHKIAQYLPATKFGAIAPIVDGLASYAKSKGWGKTPRRKTKKRMYGGAMGDGVNRMKTLEASLRGYKY